MSDILKVSVKGITPLLMNNPASMAPTKAKKGGYVANPEEEAEKATYRTENGTLALPGVQFRGSIVNAAAAFKKGRSSLKTTVSHIQVYPELVPLHDDFGNFLDKYEIDSRRAVVQHQGIIRNRPRLDEWMATFEIDYEEALVSEEVIVEILKDAGNRIGVGDYRPQRSGPFGRFALVEAVS